MRVSDADIEAVVELLQQRFGERAYELRWALERGLASVRPERDELTGCWSQLALRRGQVLGLLHRRTQEPMAQWFVHAVAVDVREMFRMLDHHGYSSVDHALARLGQALAARLPSHTAVRVHADAFAAIRSAADLAPSERSLGADTLRAIERELLAALRGPEHLTPAPERLTLVELDLSLRRVRDDAELVGTLVHAEIEAAL